MSARPASHDAVKERRGKISDVSRLLAIAAAIVMLAACEHGNMSFSQSTGTFSIPLGQGSRGIGNNH